MLLISLSSVGQSISVALNVKQLSALSLYWIRFALSGVGNTYTACSSGPHIYTINSPIAKLMIKVDMERYLEIMVGYSCTVYML